MRGTRQAQGIGWPGHRGTWRPAEAPACATQQGAGLGRLSRGLPAQPGALFGRGAEIETVAAQLLREETRLLTLTGPPGVGKTRLALAVAAELSAAFAGEVLFIDLSPLRDARLVLASIAQAAGVAERAGRPLLAGLLERFAHQRCLLLLDNFEQVLPAARDVAALLEGAPRLAVLATSRAALHLRWERTFPVPTLALPDLRRLPGPHALAGSPAVALFVERARAVRPEFALAEANAPAVAAICVRLDGLPLAIELAAARSSVLPPQALAARLGAAPCALGTTNAPGAPRPSLSGLDLLAAGATDLPARHQTLRAAIRWSYDLLAPDEQRLFRRLGVFTGTFSVEAAAAVALGPVDRTRLAAAGEPGPAPACLPRGGPDALDSLQSLVEKSLVRSEGASGAEPQFRLLETLRDYALEQLERSGEAAATYGRHAAYYLSLAEAVREWQGTAGDQWLARLEQERDNLRAALKWFVRQGDAPHGLRLAAALYGFWLARGSLGEGREALEALLALPPAAAWAADRAAALSRAGTLARAQGDYAAARALHEEELAIRRSLGDLAGVAHALDELGWTADRAGDLALARARYEESLAVYRELGDRAGVAWGLVYLGYLARQQGDHVQARALLEESLAIRRTMGDEQSAAWTLVELGNTARDAGDADAARRYYEASQAICRRLGDWRGLAWAVNSLGHLARALGDYATARARYGEGMEYTRLAGDRLNLAASLNNLASVARLEGDLATARVLYEQRLALWQEAGERRRIALALSQLAAVEHDLGNDAAAQARYEQALALQQAAEASGGWSLHWRGAPPQPVDDRREVLRWRESQAGFWERVNRQSIALCLVGLGSIAGTTGHPLRAARLLGAAAGLLERSGAALDPPDRRRYDQALVAVHAMLDEQGW